MLKIYRENEKNPEQVYLTRALNVSHKNSEILKRRYFEIFRLVL